MKAVTPVLAALLLAACASGPRPVPAGLSPVERLAFAEAALRGARGAQGTFELEADGPLAAKLQGTLTLAAGDGVVLKAEGTLSGATVAVELDSRTGFVDRSLTKGASVSANRDPPASALGEAVALGLTRLGMLHHVARLASDQGLDHADGGVADWVKVVDVKDDGVDQVDGVPCHRVGFTVQVDGQRAGEASVCVADATGLPLHRRQTQRGGAGDVTVTERFRWSLPGS